MKDHHIVLLRTTTFEPPVLDSSPITESSNGRAAQWEHSGALCERVNTPAVARILVSNHKSDELL